jgi:hypothetical protein
MQQLSDADSMFLQFERGNNLMHVASLAPMLRKHTVC